VLDRAALFVRERKAGLLQNGGSLERSDQIIDRVLRRGTGPLPARLVSHRQQLPLTLQNLTRGVGHSLRHLAKPDDLLPLRQEAMDSFEGLCPCVPFTEAQIQGPPQQLVLGYVVARLRERVHGPTDAQFEHVASEPAERSLEPRLLIPFREDAPDMLVLVRNRRLRRFRQWPQIREDVSRFHKLLASHHRDVLFRWLVGFRQGAGIPAALKPCEFLGLQLHRPRPSTLDQVASARGFSQESLRFPGAPTNGLPCLMPLPEQLLAGSGSQVLLVPRIEGSHRGGLRAR